MRAIFFINEIVFIQLHVQDKRAVLRKHKADIKKLILNCHGITITEDP